MIKQFTTLQLLSLTDGRLSTNMDDVYDMLNHIFNANFFTHQLPNALETLNNINPVWLQEQRTRLETIKATIQSDDFETLIGAIKEHYNDNVDVPQITD